MESTTSTRNAEEVRAALEQECVFATGLADRKSDESGGQTTKRDSESRAGAPADRRERREW